MLSSPEGQKDPPGPEWSEEGTYRPSVTHVTPASTTTPGISGGLQAKELISPTPYGTKGGTEALSTAPQLSPGSAQWEVHPTGIPTFHIGGKTLHDPELGTSLVQGHSGDQCALITLCFSSLCVNESKKAGCLLRVLSGNPLLSALNHKGNPLAHITAAQHCLIR